MDSSKGEDNRELIGVQNTVETTIWGLITVNLELKRLLIATSTIEDDEDRETPNEYKLRKKNKRKTRWTQKQLHG